MPRGKRRSFRRRPPLPVWVAVLLICLALYRVWLEQREPEPFPFDSARAYVVQRVVDGDTLVLAGGERVRLLGVDTPETKHPDKPVEWLGPEAADFTRTAVEGKEVRLQFDRERQDRYGRVLAYVYRDGQMLNEELIRSGYSRAETRFPYSSQMKRRFEKAEEEARLQRRGLWSGTGTSPLREETGRNPAFR